MKFYLIILSFYLLSSSVNAQTHDYKCYVRTSDGGYYIANIFASSAKNASDNLANQMIKGKKRKVKVTYVQQCVLPNQPFKGKKAKALDQITPQ